MNNPAFPPSKKSCDAERILVVSHVVWDHVVSPGWLDGPRQATTGRIKPDRDYGCCRHVDLFSAAEAMFPLVALVCSRVLTYEADRRPPYHPPCGETYGMIRTIISASSVPSSSCVSWIIKNRHRFDNITTPWVVKSSNAHHFAVAVKEVVATIMGLCLGGHLSQAQAMVLGENRDSESDGRMINRVPQCSFPALWDGRIVAIVGAVVRERVIENLRGASGREPTLLPTVCGSGHLDVVKWLVSVAGVTKEDAPWMLRRSLWWSLIRGKTEVFRYLFDEWCCRSLPESVFSEVYHWCARGLAPGNIKWCVANLGPPMESTKYDVLCNKHSTLEDCLWMEEDLHAHGFDHMYLASAMRKVDVAKWVLSALPSPPENVFNALCRSLGDVGFVQWLMTEKGFTPTSSTFKAACSTSRKKGSTLAKWLSTRVSLSQSDFTNALLSALRWSNMEVAEWLEGTFHVMDSVNSSPEVAGITLVDLCKIPDDYKGKVAGLQWFLHHLSQPSKINSVHLCHAISESIENERGNYVHVLLENFPEFDPHADPCQTCLSDIVMELLSKFDVKALDLLVSGRCTSPLLTPEFVAQCLTSQYFEPESSKAVKWAICKFDLQYSHIQANGNSLLIKLLSRKKNECVRWLLSTFEIPLSDLLPVMEKKLVSAAPDLAGLQVILDHYGPAIDATVIRQHFMPVLVFTPHRAIYTMTRFGITMDEFREYAATLGPYDLYRETMMWFGLPLAP
ncbi:hypothetical protein Pelo_11673 [Pelomyxa schiedti]|nr:hypothetical protein Pelo_11673 [Pelomyxa schiedti]